MTGVSCKILRRIVDSAGDGGLEKCGIIRLSEIEIYASKKFYFIILLQVKISDHNSEKFSVFSIKNPITLSKRTIYECEQVTYIGASKGKVQEQGQGQVQEQGQGQVQEQGQGQVQEQGQGPKSDTDSEAEFQETQTGKAKHTQIDLDSDDKPQYVPVHSEDAQPLSVPTKAGYSGTQAENTSTLSTSQLADKFIVNSNQYHG